MNVVLISIYELGRQPFGLASPAAWLRLCGRRGDLPGPGGRAPLVCGGCVCGSDCPLRADAHRGADGGARSRADQADQSHAHLCSMVFMPPSMSRSSAGSAEALSSAGSSEGGLVRWSEARCRTWPPGWIIRQSRSFAVEAPIPGAGSKRAPRRSSTATPTRRSRPGKRRVTGYTEPAAAASTSAGIAPSSRLRGPVPDRAAGGRSRRYPPPGCGGRAPHHLRRSRFLQRSQAHNRARQALHREWPDLTYDVTIKVEHLLRQADRLPILRETGCLFVDQRRGSGGRSQTWKSSTRPTRVQTSSMRFPCCGGPT